ncbi:hypothetical protein ACLI4Y_01510 [Natrialbaceae archaeon A-CW3]
MRLRQTTEETEDESNGWFDRVRGSADEPPSDDTGSLVDRVRGSSAEPTSDDSGNWFDQAKAKYGLGALLVVAGVALFLFPEPVTSTAGIALIGVGALVWLVSWLR